MSFVGLLVAAGGVWGIGLLSHHDRLVVKQISINGTKALSANAVQSTFQEKLNEGEEWFFSGMNIFLYPKRVLEGSMMQQFPRLETVQVRRESMLAQALIVSVTEREARFTWCKGSNCYLMDRDGFIFAQADDSGTSYVFGGGLLPTHEPVGQTFLRGRFERVLALLKVLEEAGFKPLGATIENETDMQIPLENGFYLKVAFGESFDDTVSNLTLITASDALVGQLDALEYVDLRFGNRVYYQMK